MNKITTTSRESLNLKNSGIVVQSQKIKVLHKKKINNGNQIEEQKEEIVLKTEKIMVTENEEKEKKEKEIVNEEPQKKELTKKEQYRKYVKESEDNCEKCPQRFLVFIPYCCGYVCLGLFDFFTYLFVPIFFCIIYTCSFICNSCKRVISNYQVEEEIGFSGAFTSENDIKLHIIDEGGAFHLTEILCFSYMSACVKRYFCFIFVLINHIVVPVLQAWQKAKKCFLKSKIEELYEERVKQVEDASSYKGYEQVETQIQINNNI